MKNLLQKLRRNNRVFKSNLKVKLTTLLCIVSLCSMRAYETKGQQSKVTLDYEKISLSHFIDEMEQHTDYRFVFRMSDVDLNRSFSIHVKDAELADVLYLVFKDTFVQYKILKNRVYLTKPEVSEEPKVKTTATNAAQNQINGVVTNENGDPLFGATVMEKGTSNGVTTNFSGEFEITLGTQTAVLVVSYMGFETQEVTVTNASNLTIQLKETAAGLDEVVITALGMKREKKALGYAVGDVESETINLVPQENVLGGLSGKVSGLDIRRAGNDLFSETYVYIRGRTSLTGNDAPLIVIDGTPVADNRVMNDLSAMNIEKVSVLKGASAAALYGSRAGNGVIIIKTKSGSKNQKGIGVSINSTTTVNVPYSYIDLQNRFTNGQKGIFDEATWQHWYGAEEGTPAVQWNSNGEAVPLRFYDNSLKDYFQTGLTTINDASISGAYDKGNFRLGISQLSGSGFTPESELKKLGLNLSTAYNITDRVQVSGNFDFSNPKSDNYPTTSMGDDPEYFDVFNIAPHININDLKDYWVVRNAEQRKVTEGYNNPWFSANERRNTFDRFRVIGNVKLDYEISNELNAMVRVSHNRTTNKEEIIRPWSYDGFGNNKPNGSYFINNTIAQETNAEVLVNYEKRFGAFRIAPSVGGNIMSNSRSVIDAGGDNLVLPGLYTLSNVSRGGLQYNSALYEKSIYSAYGLVSMSFDDKVFVDVTARNDWSSTLPKENRSYFYPSVSTGILISEMVNMPSWVSLVKVRSSWAQVGKDTDPYMINPTLSQGYWGDNFTYSLPSSMPNTNLKPEIANSFEIGTDLKFFNGRLGFDGTYYKTQNKNQILNVAVSPLTGYTSTTINAGNVENYGIELGMNIIPIKTNDLEWNMHFNFTKQESKLVELVDGIDRVDFGGGTDMGAFTRVGGKIGDLYSPYVQKVQEGEYAGWNLLDANGRWVVDRNRENQINVGNFNNDFSVGFTTSVTYKNFTLSASADWRQGGEFFSESMKRMARSGKIENWNNGISSSTFTGILSNNSFNGDNEALANEIKNNPIYQQNHVWVGGRNEELGGFPYNGNNNGAFFPGVIDNGDGTYTENFGGEGTRYFDAYRVVESSGSFWRLGEYFMYDASFVKLRDITLTYKFSPKVAKFLSAQNVSLSCYAKNIMLWTKAKINIDPELAYDNGQQGFDKWNIAPWTIPMGVRLNVVF